MYASESFIRSLRLSLLPPHPSHSLPPQSSFVTIQSGRASSLCLLPPSTTVTATNKIASIGCGNQFQLPHFIGLDVDNRSAAEAVDAIYLSMQFYYAAWSNESRSTQSRRTCTAVLSCRWMSIAHNFPEYASLRRQLPATVLCYRW